MTVALEARQPGHLILLDTFYPGWEARVDGRDAKIEPANAAFRAVAVPAGRHEVRFSYRPASVRAGGIVSVVALVVLLLGYLMTKTATVRAGTVKVPDAAS